MRALHGRIPVSQPRIVGQLAFLSLSKVTGI
jgi:hypothetical protein